MGRVDIPLGPQPEPVQELPQCAWCGERSKTVCSRCKARAYCSVECQRLDWRSGHQTACVATVSKKEEKEEPDFQFYHLPYVARWAINVKRWPIQRGGKEFTFLLSRIPEEPIREYIAGLPWREAKVALAKELAVRRLAEIMTQAMWHKVQWKHDDASDRDYLADREHYVWTGKKYQNANMRFPNFNFSITEVGDYLFVVSHPVALTGISAGGPLSDAMPDPREAFAAELAEARSLLAQGATPAEDATTTAQGPFQGEEPEGGAAAPTDEEATSQRAAVQPCDLNSGDAGGREADDSSLPEVEADPEEDQRMLGPHELLEICQPDAAAARRCLLRQAFVSKFAYFRTIGKTKGRQWSQVVLRPEPVEDPEEPEERRHRGPKRHLLLLSGTLQRRWRCDVHNWRGYCIVVCRAPPEETSDLSGEFKGTQATRSPEIDLYDTVLEHTEPEFVEVPIQQLLPEKWHSDYVRACGGGEKGEQVRMNFMGSREPHIPRVLSLIHI